MQYKKIRGKNLTMTFKMTDPEVIRSIKDARQHLKIAMQKIKETQNIIREALS